MFNAASSSSGHFTSLPIELKPTYKPNWSATKLLPFAVKSKASTAEMAPATCSSSSSSLYQVLGIGNGATLPEIKAAYRGLARVLHPDARSNGHSSSAGEFIKLHEAYETLSDPEKRAAYDRSLFWGMSSTAMAGCSGTRFRRFHGQRWETDQCW